MRFAGLLSLLFLPLLALAASPKEKFVELAAAGNGVIKLDSKLYDTLTGSKRDWSTAVVFTALDPKRRCIPCKEFNPSWQSVAKAWSKVAPAERNEHFFATIDFDDAPNVFQKMGLTAAPVVYIFPPTEGSRVPASGRTSPLKYDFSTGFEAGPLAEHLSNHTPVPIPYRDPINWGRVFTTGFLGLSLLLVLRYSRPLLQNKWIWAAGSIITSLVMTSGFMFTRIRGSAYTGPDGGWIAAGFQNQFGQEVQVVSFIYGILGFSFLMLILAVPHQTSPSKQRVQIYIWSAVTIVIYSMLVSLFRVKNRAYPFKLFL
ncbi:hypothetical protein AX16_003662 [Volvariella volvacea WC 439]|nr:hypothetical protein AX16_003662 [Volvariella volvacea WC 439]